MWLIELLWGVLLLEMAESLFKAERAGRGWGEEKKKVLLKKNPYNLDAIHDHKMYDCFR